MFRFPRNLSIKRKITLVILVTSTACLIVACIALFAFQLLSIRRSFINDLSATGEILANSSMESVALNNKELAEDILGGLKAKPHVASANIIKKDGTMFAHFGKPDEPAMLQQYPLENGFVSYHKYLLHSQPIINPEDEERIGTLHLRSDFRSVYLPLLKLYGGILALVLLVCSLLAFVISARLQRFVSDPILKLAETARTISENKDYSMRAPHTDQDELGIFTDAFNEMLTQIETKDVALQSAQQKLENQVKELQREISERERAEHQLADAHTQLVETSRQAGMAEVATGVLHNVGNVLNSVNVSATLVSDRVRDSKAENLTKVAALLREHADHLEEFFASDPRGKLLLEYLPNLGAHLNEERSDMLGELELLTKNLDHIKDIVAMQQSYARVSGVVEPVSITSLVEDALQINAAALNRHGVEVIRNYTDVPAIAVDKHKVLQILVNLIRNAKYAMDECVPGKKQLVIGIDLTPGRNVRVTVKDTGEGILPENLVRIFSHGFTTKKDGHGFGLHTSALAASDMKGALSASSDGPGTGATFTLELPLALA